MTQNDLKAAIVSINNTLATNNPKGLTEALKREGYPVDNRFDILSYDTLTKALWELYISNPDKWATVVQSVPFNYQKTDSSTSPATKTLFENISRSYNPSYSSSLAKEENPKWWQTALGYVLGSTTTVHQGTPEKSTISAWAYVGLAVLGLAIVAIVFFAFRTKGV